MSTITWTRPSLLLRLAVILLVLISTVGCDQATKHLARTQLGPDALAVAPGGFIQLVLAENPGAFLSLGASLPGALRGGIFTLAVGIGLALLLAYLLRTSWRTPLRFFSLGLIWSGGMSNLLDRVVRHGLVTDFIYLRAGPLNTGVFNLADLAIVAGIALMLVSIKSVARGSKRT